MSVRVREALRVLGIERLAFGVHDACFPCAPDEDLGRGGPYGEAARDLLAYVAELGFDTLQLGPQGDQGPDEPSPYDGAAFDRSAVALSLAALPNLSDATRARLVRGVDPTTSDHRRAVLAMREALAEAKVDPQEEHRRQHAALRADARSLGLALFADLQIGWAERDVRAAPSLFLPGLRLGAPPSRTNPEGQPWGYPVLDPTRPEAIGRLIEARFAGLAAEYDGVRIDHPHGWVCPWVYEDGADVKDGARLHESPDLPALAPYSFVRRDQLALARQRWDEGWVRELDDAQVDRYARWIALLIGVFGGPRAVACEVLSTMPYPLGRVVERHGLGRFRVTQKADPSDPSDVYRSERARPEDWIMVGTHDTEPIWSVTARWVADGTAAAHARYLEERLRQPVAIEPKALAQAKLAELFTSPARSVFVWWGDWLGETEVYNRPGVIDPRNWTLRIPRDFRAVHARRAAAGAALDLRAAVATALRARGHHEHARALAPDGV